MLQNKKKEKHLTVFSTFLLTFFLLYSFPLAAAPLSLDQAEINQALKQKQNTVVFFCE